MTRPSSNPFAVPKPRPKPPVTPDVRTWHVPADKGTWRVMMHWRSWKASSRGQKTALIVPTNEGVWSARVKPGDKLKLTAVKEPRKPVLMVKVTGVCRHRHLGDIPICDTGHDPATLLPATPTWLEVLQRAATGGAPGKETGTIGERGSLGWTVVTYELAD